MEIPTRFDACRAIAAAIATCTTLAAMGAAHAQDLPDGSAPSPETAATAPGPWMPARVGTSVVLESDAHRQVEFGTGLTAPHASGLPEGVPRPLDAVAIGLRVGF